MYPMIYFQSFRQLVSGNEVFVAMPMSDPDFEPIWNDVYQGAIGALGLTPFRVDVPPTGDSILIDILSGLRRAKLILADISADSRSGEYPNANVMYELGIAHAIRLPETVVVVRRTGAKIPFDVRHIRARDYDRNDLPGAQMAIRSYLENALAFGRSLRDELVESAWLAMDPVCRTIIAEEWYVASGRAAQLATERGEEFHNPDSGMVRYPQRNTSYRGWHDEQLFPAFNRLIEFGIMEAAADRWDIVGRDEPPRLYRFTVLGEEMAARFTSVST
jgi:hypothetical protein